MKHLYTLILVLTLTPLIAQNSKVEFMSTKNGNFENGITGWSKGNNAHQISIESSDAFAAPTGSTKSAKITLSNTGGDLAVIKHSQFTSLDEQNIRFALWVKAAAPNTTIRFRKNETINGNSSYTKTQPFTFTDTNWHKIVINRTGIPAGAKSGLHIIGDDKTTPGAVFYIDDVTATDDVLDNDFEIEGFTKFNNGIAAITIPVTADPTSNQIQHTWTASKIWVSQVSGGSNQIQSYEYSTEQKAQGNRSLKVVTNANASDAKLGVVQVRLNDAWIFRYRNKQGQTVGGSDATTYDKLKYTVSYKIMSTSNAIHTANMKIFGIDNYVGVHNLTANTWKTITKEKVIDRSTMASTVKHSYPVFRFNSPSATYYVDDFQITWEETNDAILSIEDVNDITIGYYPNPVKEVINFANLEKPSNVHIFDVTGKVVLSKQNVSKSIDLSSLQKGVYFINVTNNTFKFIKE